MSFSDRLKELRKSRNLTQKQVYEAVGMSAIGYQRYEYGDREPAYQNLLALARFFNVSIDYLVGYKIKEISVNDLELDSFDESGTDDDPIMTLKPLTVKGRASEIDKLIVFLQESDCYFEVSDIKLAADPE